MALTELQLPTKADLYRGRQNMANRLDGIMKRLEDEAESLGFFTTGDLVALGVPAEVQTDLAQYRTAVGEILAFYKGESTTQTKVPSDIIDSIRSLV